MENLNHSGGLKSNLVIPDMLLEKLQAAYVLHDAKTRIVAWNHKALELLGLTSEQILGKTAMDPQWHFVDEYGSVIPYEKYPVNQVISHRKNVDHYIVGIEAQVHKKTLWVQASAVPIFDRSKLTHVFVTFMDISEQFETKRQLRASEQRYKSVISAMSEGLVMQMQSGEIVTCNSAAEEILGLTEDQMRGRTSIDPRWRSIHEDGSDFPGEDHPAMVTLRTGKPIKDVVMGVKKPNGKLTWININTAPIFDKKQKAANAVVATFSDITYLKNAENKLLDNTRFQTTVIEGVTDGLCVCHATESYPFVKFTIWNNRMIELTGYSKEKINTLGWYQTLYPDEELQQKAIERMGEMRTGKNLEQEEWPIVRADGEKRIFSISTQLLSTEEHHGNVLALIKDITEQKRAEQELRQAATVIASTFEGVMVTDSHLKIVFINQAFSNITGYSQEEVMGKTPAILKSNRHKDSYYKDMWITLETEGHWQGEIWNRRKNGEIYPEWLSISRVLDDKNQLKNYVGVFSDITSVKQSEEKLFFLAHHDALTGLPNRFHFYSQAEQALERANRDKKMFAILFIDLDHFKHINDSFGHPTGDEVLIIIGDRIRSSLRKKDIIARIGGDEFIVLLEDVANFESIANLTNKLHQSISIPVKTDDLEFYVSASIGISLYPENGQDITTLVSNADAAMYRAKYNGRAAFQFYSVDMTESMLQRITLENDLRQALLKNELFVNIQPVIKGKDNLLYGAELMIRWLHPELGYQSPEQFIPIAEESDLIIEIGEYVLNQACKLAQEIYQDIGPNLKFSVNLSTRQLQRPNSFNTLSNILKKYNFPISMLEFEITENIFAEPSPELLETMQKLRSFGISIALDDFGTGFSSLAYLKKFPIDKLKIDRSFIKNIPQDESDVEITKAIIALGKSLHLQVVAEGVETEEQYQFLINEGCEFQQGFLHSKPVSLDEFSRLAKVRA